MSGRDVEQIIRDLVEIGIAIVRDKKREQVQAQGPYRRRRPGTRCLCRPRCQPCDATEIS